MIRFALCPLVLLFVLQVVQADELRAQTSRSEPNSAVKNPQAQEQIDFDRARQLLREKQSGGKLSADQEAYLERAIEARRRNQRRGNARGRDRRTLTAGDRTGLKPCPYPHLQFDI